MQASDLNSFVFNEIARRYPADGDELLIALAIGRRARDDGAAFALGVEDLAADTGVIPRLVRLHLRKMLAFGWLVPLDPPGGGDPGRPRHCYAIDPDWLAASDRPSLRDAGPRVPAAEKAEAA